jgi:hypothetical protein
MIVRMFASDDGDMVTDPAFDAEMISEAESNVVDDWEGDVDSAVAWRDGGLLDRLPARSTTRWSSMPRRSE